MHRTAFRKLIDWHRSGYSQLRMGVLNCEDGLALNLGCGRRPLDGFNNVDIVPGPGVQTIADLNDRLPFDDESANLIYADNVFEHIENYLGLLGECRRVLRPGGRLVVDVPYFRSAGAFVDPTHRNFFTLRSMRYFIPNTYESINYAYLPVLFTELFLILDPDRSGWFRAITSFLANTRPEWVEDTLLGTIVPIQSIRYVLSR